MNNVYDCQDIDINQTFKLEGLDDADDVPDEIKLHDNDDMNMNQLDIDSTLPENDYLNKWLDINNCICYLHKLSTGVKDVYTNYDEIGGNYKENMDNMRSVVNGIQKSEKSRILCSKIMSFSITRWSGLWDFLTSLLKNYRDIQNAIKSYVI